MESAFRLPTSYEVPDACFIPRSCRLDLLFWARRPLGFTAPKVPPRADSQARANGLSDPRNNVSEVIPWDHVYSRDINLLVNLYARTTWRWELSVLVYFGLIFISQVSGFRAYLGTIFLFFCYASVFIRLIEQKCQFM